MTRKGASSRVEDSSIAPSIFWSRAAHGSFMFRLIVSVRRGTASSLPGAWERHPTLEQARAAAAALLHHERVTRIAVVRDEVPPAFVEWLER
jgi:hypothetical protein